MTAPKYNDPVLYNSSRVKYNGDADDTTGKGRPPKVTASAKRPTVTAR